MQLPGSLVLIENRCRYSLDPPEVAEKSKCPSFEEQRLGISGLRDVDGGRDKDSHSASEAACQYRSERSSGSC